MNTGYTFTSATFSLYSTLIEVFFNKRLSNLLMLREIKSYLKFCIVARCFYDSYVLDYVYLFDTLNAGMFRLGLRHPADVYDTRSPSSTNLLNMHFHTFPACNVSS